MFARHCYARHARANLCFSKGSFPADDSCLDKKCLQYNLNYVFEGAGPESLFQHH